MTPSLLTGAVLGLSVAAPFGPVSLMCVQNSLNRGVVHGAVGGCGAATAHGMFATAAVAGAGITSAILAPWANAIHAISSLVLIALGVRTMARAGSTKTPASQIGLRATYGSLLLLSLSNPMTILPYLAVATVVTGAAHTDAALSLWSVPGVMVAASSWYAGISVVAAIFRGHLNEGMARLLNLAAGAALISFGVLVGVHFFSRDFPHF